MWHTLLWTAFFGSHWQDVFPLAAPVAAVLLFVFTRRRSWASAGPVLALGAWCWFALVSTLNTSWAQLPLIRWVTGHAQLLYTLPLYVALASTDLIREARHIARGAAGAVLASVPIPLTLWLLGHSEVLGRAIGRGGRYSGLLGDNSTAGALGAATIILAVLLLISQEQGASWAPRWLWGSALTFAIAGFVFAQSRGYSAGVAAAVVVLASIYHFCQRSWAPDRATVSRRRWLVAASGILIIAAFFAIAPRYAEPDTVITARRSTEARLALFDRAVELWSSSPVVGLGVGTFEQNTVAITPVLPGVSFRDGGEYLDEIRRFDPEGGQHAHNQLLQLLVEGGLIGAVMLLAAVSWPLRTVVRNRHGHRSPALVAGAAAALTVPFVSGLAAGRSLTAPSQIILPFAILLFAQQTAHERDGGDTRDDISTVWIQAAPHRTSSRS